MNTQRVEVFHITNCDTVVETVAHHFIFHFFPTTKRFFHQYLRRERERFFYKNIQLLFVITEAGAQATQCIRRPDNYRITQFFCCATGIFHIFYGFTLNGLYIDFIQFLNKKFTILGIHNGLYRSTEYFYIIFFKNTFFVQCHSTVQGCLTTERQHNAFRFFFLNHFLYEIRSHRKEVDLIRHSFGRLYRSNIRIDKNRFNAFFFQGFECLRTGIVKLTGLTDLQGTGTQQQYFLYIFFH